MRWLEASSLSVNLWERSKLQSLQLDTINFAGQQKKLAFCLINFVWSWSVLQALVWAPDCLFLLLQQTSQGICHFAVLSQLKLWKNSEKTAGYFENASTLKTKKPSGIKYVDINRPSSTTASRILYRCYFQERSSCCSRIWAPCSARQLNMLDVFKSSVQRFQRFQSSCGRNHVPDLCP